MRSLVAFLISLIITGLVVGPSSGQQVRGYVIGPDDVLEITVTNHDDLNKTVTVQDDGSITFPEVGNIVASGKSPRELAAAIKLGLEKTRNKVEVLVSPKEIHSL